MSDSAPRGRNAAAPVNGPIGLDRHIRSRGTSYPTGAVKVNRRRVDYPNLSPTRPPADRSDLALWPAWTRVPLARIGFTVLAEDGTPVGAGGGY